MLLSTWFATHCPHATHHVCICCSPHGSHECSTWFTYTVHIMLSISPYAFLHMVLLHAPQATHHVCICYSPHGLYCILPMLDIMPPYASLHTVPHGLSTCCSSCLHMLPSTRFTCHCPHVINHVCICYCPHGWYACVHMPKTIYHQQGITLRTHCTPTSGHMVSSTCLLTHGFCTSSLWIKTFLHKVRPHAK